MFCSSWTESLFQTGSVADTYIVQTVSPACDWALCTQTCGISSPCVLHAEIPLLLWKQWGWNALSETVNIGAALKLAYVVYVSSSLVYLLSSAGCVSWNVQRCSCCFVGVMLAIITVHSSTLVGLSWATARQESHFPPEDCSWHHWLYIDWILSQSYLFAQKNRVFFSYVLKGFKACF